MKKLSYFYFILKSIHTRQENWNFSFHKLHKIKQNTLPGKYTVEIRRELEVILYRL